MAYPILDAWLGDVAYHRKFSMSVSDPSDQGRNEDHTRYVQRGSAVWCRLLEPQSERLYYEVIRLCNGIPLFWQDHLNRLQATLTGSGMDLIRAREPLLSIAEHAVVNYLSHPLVLAAIKLNRGEANLKIVVSATSLTIYLSESYYPTPRQFDLGVPTEVMVWERQDPHIKEIKADYKAAVAAAFATYAKKGKGESEGTGTGPDAAAERPPFELLLADRVGHLTEGSRSNLFFVKRQTIISPPEELILKGITRKYVLKAISEAGFTLKEGLFSQRDLERDPPDGAFITASPIDILPLSRIGEHRFDPAGMAVAKQIGAAYQKEIRTILDRDRDLFKAGCGRSQNLY